MKNYWITAFIMAAVSLYLNLEASSEKKSTQPQKMANPINSVRNIELHEGRFSTQVMFYFSRPIFCKRKVDTSKQLVKIGFPGMNLKQFKQEKVINTFNKLKDKGILNSFSLEERTGSVPQVNVSMVFADHKKLSEKNNDFIIKWTKLEQPFRLVLDIFSNEQLQQLKKQENIILYAANSLVQTSPTISKKNNKKLKIVIDPGHGGKHPGCIAFNLKEKDVALDIAQQLRTLLAKDAHETFLTRSKDLTLSLGERSSFSDQMKADLFISIHANGAAKNAAQVSGLETYHLKENIFSPQDNGGFMAFSKKAAASASHLQELLEKNCNYSAHLAQEIQQKTLNEIKLHNYSCIDRGVKQNDYHTLLRNIVPSALVEVGFITNQEEANKLKRTDYRNLLAKGIYNGINSYIKTHY